MERLIARQPEDLKQKQDIDANVLHEVKEIDVGRGRILLESEGGSKTRWEPFDSLMVSTGALPVRPPVEGIDAEGIFGVGTLQNALDLWRFMEQTQPTKAVVIGGGYIGLEMAENLLLRDMDVSLVEKAPEVMGTLDADMGALVSKALVDVGVNLYTNEGLKAFEAAEGRVRKVITEKRTLPADLVILGMGVRPNISLARQAGIKIGVSGAVEVDSTMRTGVDGVWAGGDCTESFHLVSRRPVTIALGTVANKHGRVAGSNIGGVYATFPGVVGTAVSKICSVEVARTGLQEKEIGQIGKEYVSAVIDTTTRAGYYPDTGPITVKVLAEKGNGRLLGGQIVGKEGAAKRIDVLATALHAGLTLEEIVHLDLSYAPPYSPLNDPVAVAARVALKKLVGNP